MIAVFLITYKACVYLTNIHGFLGVFKIPEMLGFFLAFILILLVINAFNLIDGIDGLAGSLGLMASTCLGAYFLLIGSIPYCILAFSLAGSLTAFLIFNRSPAKIFMGDTGSLLIGLVVSILVVHFINVAPSDTIFPIAASPAIGFSIILIPLLDTCRVFGIRIFKGHSPFIADKKHIHHVFLDLGLPHNRITSVLVFANSLLIVVAYLSKSVGSTVLIFFETALFFITMAFFNNNFRKKVKYLKGKTIALKFTQRNREIKLSQEVNDFIVNSRSK